MERRAGRRQPLLLRAVVRPRRRRENPVNALSSLAFPVLRFVRGMVFPARSLDDARTCTKTALTKGFFRRQLILDSEGRTVLVRDARKLHGVGPFWGYNIFLNQRVLVELDAEIGPQISLEEARSKVLSALRGPQQWDSADTHEDLVAHVTQARSVAALVEVITEAYGVVP